MNTLLRFAVIAMLGYFIVDIATSLIAKCFEYFTEPKRDKASNHCLDSEYALGFDDAEPIKIDRSDIDLPEISDTMAKKVSRAQKKL